MAHNCKPYRKFKKYQRMVERVGAYQVYAEKTADRKEWRLEIRRVDRKPYGPWRVIHASRGNWAQE